MDVHEYLIDHADIDWSLALQEWNWLLPSEFSVWLLTRTGDLFITIPEGQIYMLDVGAGTLQQVAMSRDEFCAKIDEPGTAEDWLMIPIVDRLVASGAHLGPGQCYSFRPLPPLGGDYGADNRMVFGIREHFGGWGSVQRQISQLPDGSQVVIKTTPQNDRT